ncbi:MAG: glycerophosphodiester phosphodiesterase [Salinarimonadaceae bacterium]|nr:MAG: glycerophosphodiester phosphodiesterase [Salinarimonadaceae bacterium]
MRQYRRHPYLDYPLPIAFAHRGGGLEAEENTMAAFERAVGLGYTHVELDVRATSDGVVVIHHDETLERMTGDSRAVAELDWAELSRVTTRGGETAPRLDELLSAFPGLCVNIEPKSDSVLEPLAELLRRADAVSRVGIGCFDPNRTLALRRMLGEELCWSPAHAGVLRLWLAGWGLPIATDAFQMVQVPMRYRGVPVVTRRFVEVAHARGVQVHVWTVDEEAEMERLLNLGADALMTDRPSLLRAVLQRRGQWRGG